MLGHCASFHGDKAGEGGRDEAVYPEGVAAGAHMLPGDIKNKSSAVSRSDPVLGQRSKSVHSFKAMAHHGGRGEGRRRLSVTVDVTREVRKWQFRLIGGVPT